MAAKVSGRYSIEIIHQSDKERFKCALCLDIVKIATHGCKSHVFCKECIEGYIENSRNKGTSFCPAGCGKPLNRDKLEFNEAIDHFVNTLACKCTDCSWTGDLYDFVQQHLLNCKEKKVQCHLCNGFIKRKELETHVSDICDNRKMECQYCYKEVRYCEHVSHEDVCQNSEVECYYKKFGCTEMIKRKTMEFHNQSNNQKHLFLVTKYFEDKNESLQMVNKDLIVMNQTLEKKLQKLEKQNTDMKYKLSTHILLYSKNKLLKESFKNVLDVKYKSILLIKDCNIGFDLLTKYFDTKDYLTIAEDLIRRCKELEEYKDELGEIIEKSPMVRFTRVGGFYLFFKIQSFTAYQYFTSGEPLLEKINGKYFHNYPSSFNCELFISKWAITLTNTPVDLSKPDERFKLSPLPFINDIYGCLVIY